MNGGKASGNDSGYDVLCLSETHCDDNDGLWNKVESSRLILCEKRPAGDPASGVAIILSVRASKIVKDKGHIGSRICWVKLGTSYGRYVWIVNGYIPHFYRQSPSGQDTYAELHAFLLTTNLPLHLQSRVNLQSQTAAQLSIKIQRN